MTRGEFNGLVVPCFRRCYPSTVEWLQGLPDGGRDLLAQWFVELAPYRADDVTDALEQIRLGRSEKPEPRDRECWPAFIRRYLAKLIEAKRARTEWKTDGSVWSDVTQGKMAAAYRKCVEILREAVAAGASDEIDSYGKRRWCEALERRKDEWTELVP